jgi:membrane-bound ClpP family serine protease
MEYNNENIKVTANEISEIIREHKTRSNKDLVVALEFVKKDFELTKESVLKMTEHLDKLEVAYNTILKEYKSRNGK